MNALLLRIRSVTFKGLVFVLVPLVLLALGGAIGKFWADSNYARQAGAKAIQRQMSLIEPYINRLAERFADADGDLVADTPKDLKDLLDPEVIKFSYIASADASGKKETWRKFIEELSKAVDRPVEYVVFENIDEQIKALREGQLHLTALNTGSVPLAVNTCGFVPLCTLGHSDGTFGYTMKIIVPAGSQIRELKDLRGRMVTFTHMLSLSGFKAPVVALLNAAGLRPERDYHWSFTHDPEASIRLVADGESEAAAVPSDVLAKSVERGDIQDGRFRTIYESPAFPPATVGCLYRLKPDLVEKIKSAILAIDWKKTRLDSVLGAGEAGRFVPVSYFKEFACKQRSKTVARRGPA